MNFLLVLWQHSYHPPHSAISFIKCFSLLEFCWNVSKTVCEMLKCFIFLVVYRFFDKLVWLNTRGFMTWHAFVWRENLVLVLLDSYVLRETERKKRQWYVFYRLWEIELLDKSFFFKKKKKIELRYFLSVCVFSYENKVIKST